MLDSKNEIKNIILITIDSLRADHLSCLGYQRKITPNMDELAKKGILFSQMISNGSGTPSAVPPIMTSTYPLMYGGYESISRERITIAEVLKKYNYSTAAFHSNTYLSRFYGYNRGFDVFYDDLIYEKDRKKNKIFAHVNRKLNSIYKILSNYASAAVTLKKPVNWYLPYMSANLLNQKAISWFRENNPERFFLWMHYMDVHTPYMPPEKFVKEINEDLTRYQVLKANKYFSKSKEISKKDLDNLMDLYDAGIKYMDSAIFSFISQLETDGFMKDTMVIITADHGEEFMEHGDLNHHSKLYDELIHVPLIIYAPDHINDPKVIHNLVEHLDIAPTILNALGIKKFDNFLGESLLPLIDKEENDDKGVISETSDPPNVLKIDPQLRKTSYRTFNWKYIHYANKVDELYNVLKDPHETTNLVDVEKDIAGELYKKILDHIDMENRHKLNLEKEIIQKRIGKLKIKGKI